MKIKIIINPKSKNGKNKNIESILEERFFRSGYNFDIEYTRFPRHASLLSQQAVRDKYDTVIAVGGDGTINEVINGIANSEIALGIIPTGTANDLASFYKIPININKACDIIFQNEIHKIDLIQVNNWYYITAGGTGLPCKVTDITARLKSNPFIGKMITHILGSKIYILALLCAYFNKKSWSNTINIQTNNSIIQTNPLFFMINNQPFLGKHFHIAPGAKNNDRFFDVCLAEKSNNHLKNFSVLIKTLFGKHILSSAVKLWQDSDITVYSKKPFHMMGDGELQQKESEYRIQCIPAALNLIVPKLYYYNDIEPTIQKKMKCFPENGFIRRMWIYLKAMHPLSNRFVYVLFLFLSLSTLLSTIHLRQLQFFLWPSISGIMSVFIFILILRLMDELKDKKIDAELFPTRPLPSGRVFEFDISFSLTFLVVINLLINSWSIKTLATALLVTVYMFLMFKFFFIPEIMRRNLLLSLITHNPIVPLLIIYIVVNFSVQNNIDFDKLNWHETSLLLLLFWMPFLAWEISRKIRCKEEENAYITYSQILGRTGSVFVLIAIQTIALVLGIYFFNRLSLTPIYLLILLFGYLVTIFAGFRFLFKPDKNTSKLKPFVEIYIFSIFVAVLFVNLKGV